LLTIHLIYFGISILVETREDHQVASAIWPFLLIRLIVALGVLIGMRHRRYIARKVTRGLCTLGLILCGVVVIYILTVGVTSLHQYALLKIASAHCLVWFALLACLGTKSATKWFSE
jgi:4-amino-4-deoxy-L-arabinose transferase-like glycosyltransferase